MIFIKKIFTYSALVFIGIILQTLYVQTGETSSYREKSGEVCLTDEAVLKDLNKKKTEIKEKEESLSKIKLELDEREKVLKEEFAKLEEIRKEIAGLEAEKKEEQEQKVTKLVETIEKMSPKSAGQLLERVDDHLAVMAMSRINTPRLAKIMNGMKADRVSKLSELMTIGEKKLRTPAAKQEASQ